MSNIIVMSCKSMFQPELGMLAAHTGLSAAAVSCKPPAPVPVLLVPVKCWKSMVAFLGLLRLGA